MYISSILALTTLTALSLALPTTDKYTWSVNDFSFECTKDGCPYSFTLDAPGDEPPAPPVATTCSGSALTGIWADCADEKVQTRIFGGARATTLQIKMEFPNGEATYTYSGHKKVSETVAGTKQPKSFPVVVSQVSAVE